MEGRSVRTTSTALALVLALGFWLTPSSVWAQVSGNPAERPPGGGGSKPGGEPKSSSAAATDFLKARTFDELLKAGRTYLTTRQPSQVRGQAQASLEQIATEAAQILGQIVVDRAS